ncbi:1-deoxy-D-xylulose-5-phosphate reductoisomerase [uncultured Alistipes sp.]|uniref:1-deoxy-D-xylulose-5-phosphate reductoisomerase n=1 Tax=uncultured Alistipes sp. TaxID=538949 RepID=UPI003209FDC0
MKQRLAILGSTGSIGAQTLDIVRENPERFEVRILTAHRNWEQLARQAREFDADTVVIADKQHYQSLCEALEGTDTKVYAGEEAVAQVAAGGDSDVVVNALVGYAGLAPTVAAIGARKKLALANKESLVVGGACVMPLARERRAPVIPIDSEHSAIFQCLLGERAPVRRLIITCSGGAFRDIPREELAHVTVEQALRHPQWHMGAKITIDSSTLVNKGFEVIEAHWLFGTPADRISVVMHPQSIVHSMVEFEDGAIKAQLGSPDMRMPISFALMYPDRAKRPAERFSFVEHPQLSFAEVDGAKYPALGIAYECLRRGGTAACTMNGANEVAVAAFLDRKCAWLDIVRTIEHALQHASFVARPSLDDYAAVDAEARRLAAEFLKVRRPESNPAK